MKALLLLIVGCFGLPWTLAQVADLKEPEIYSLKIVSDIKYRFATTLVTSRVKNPAETLRETIFKLTLPNEAFITNLTLEIDGKIIVGEIKRKEEARRQYVAAQARGESAGYIGTQHRETNKFDLAVSVAPMGKVTFNLTYQELLQRKNGQYEQVVYIDPGQLVPEMDITVNILESRNITDLNIPPLRNDVGENLMDIGSLMVTSRPTPQSAYVYFAPSKEQQMTQSDKGIAGKFSVQYDVERSMDAGDILMVNGYFVHFFAPDGLEAMPNDVLFILDQSGSMSGTKMSQMKEAMLQILDVMNEGDRINIMTFSSGVSPWRGDMSDVDDEDDLEAAKDFIRSIQARGSTNINNALHTGIEYMAAHRITDVNARARSPVIVFLTDGEATAGETNTNAILDNIKEAKLKLEIDIPIFTLAFGSGADFDLVKKIAIKNGGFGKRIYEASDAAMQISGFYGEISMTLLKNLTFEYLDAPVSNLTQNHFETYFDGSEVIVAGKLDDYNVTVEEWFGPKMQVTTISAEGPRVLVLTDNIIPDMQSENDDLLKIGDYEKITEKVWAYLTIKQLLDEELASSYQTEKLQYKKKILDLSLKYKFVTPLTSMVVTQNEESEEATEIDEIDVLPILSTQDIQPKTISGRQYSQDSARFLLSQNRPMARLPPIGQSAYIGGRTQTDPIPDSYSAGIPNYFSGTGAVPFSYVPPDSARMVMAGHLMDDLDQMADISGGRVHSKSQNLGTRKDKKRRRKQKGNRKGDKGLPVPLQVAIHTSNLSSPICFYLYSKRLADGDVYLLYSDKVMNITIEMAERTSGKKKSKLGAIRALTITTGNTTERITSMTSQLELSIDAFRMRTAPIGNFITIFIDSNDEQNLNNNGLLGSILSKKISRLPKSGSSKRSWLQIGKKSVKSVQMKVPVIEGKIHRDKATCWRTPKEAVMYKLHKYKITT